MKDVEKHLSSLLASGQIPHALLFSGPRGAGKQKAAYQFASQLLKNRKKIEFHPDLHLFFPEGKTEMHPVSAIRQLIHDAVLAPFEAPWKIFILHEAEKMLPTSSNALLKILEEPPPHTLILLLSVHPERLLPTILSRCQMIEFPPSTEKNIDTKVVDLLVSGASKCSDFESEHPDAVFETLLFWYRDRLVIELGGDSGLLHFPQHVGELKKIRFISLDRVEKAARQSRLAYERSTKLSVCLEMFFLSLRQETR